MADLLPGFMKPSDVPSGWEAVQICDIASVVQGGRLGLTKAEYGRTGFPAFSAAGQDGFVDRAEFSQPAVVLSSIGANCGRCFRADGSWSTLANTQAILPNHLSVDYRYLCARLDDERYWLRSGSAQPFVKPSNVKRSWILQPPLEEQRRIAEILDTIDEAIRATERVIAKHKQVRSGLASDLLSGKCGSTLRESQESRDVPQGCVPRWEKRQLGDVGTVIGGGTPPRENPTCWGDFIPWLTPGELTDNDRKFVAETRENISAQGLADSGARLVPVGSLLMTSRASIGFCALAATPMTTNQGFKNLIPHTDIDSSFLFFVGRTLQREMLRRASGTTFLEISTREFERIEILLPPLEEQRRIAEILDSIDETIRSNDAQRHKLLQIRSGLAADLLSGCVRTVAA